MIYNEEYKLKFYEDSVKGGSPVFDYLKKIEDKHRSKIYKQLEFLKDSGGYVSEPYGRHIIGKIRELRVDFSNNYYRILYFTYVDKNIIILHAFLKRTDKTPNREIKIALNRYNDIINNSKIYED
jgi:phage-related protein